MIDEFGALVSGTRALQFPTEDGARQAYREAAARGEVQTIRVQREYIVVE